jgi:NAD(P)-dependent dehydrogenase (short-subunit alcohol dehydrogenase family)
MGMVDGAIALVTGAGSGIGRASAVLFAQEGAAGVVVADVDADGVQITVAAVEAAGAAALPVHVDIADDASVAAMVRATLDRFGRLDCAHNNAGVAGAAGRTADCTEENWRHVIDVNLTGTWLCVKHEITAMRALGGGSIVNTASTVGLIANVGLPAYVASKHGILGLTKAAAVDHRHDNVRVNAICPGATLTGMMRANAGDTPDKLAAIERAQPGGRIAAPEEQAAAAVWLCSPHASFVTGTYLVVDNGAMLGGTVTHID